MPRIVRVAAAQTGPIERDEPRASTVRRLCDLMRQAADRQADLVVFPEAALTPFFPHWAMTNQSEIDCYFEGSLPREDVRPLFDLAEQFQVGFCLGYAERIEQDGRVRHFNSCVLVGRDGALLGKYRKIHLPGYADVQPGYPYENLEKRYFEVGDLGFPVWDAFGGRIGMCICNDRRWPETYRVMGLQGVELVLVGYNTPSHNPAMPEPDRFAMSHNHLSMQAGAYQNGTWVVGVAKAGTEAGVHQIGGSCVIAPSGEIVAMASSEDDEVVVAAIDLDDCRTYKEQMFNLAAHRRPEHYGPICAPVVPTPPPGVRSLSMTSHR